MLFYAIVETDQGYEIVPVPEGSTVDAVARELGAAVVDEGPYRSFEEAQDVLAALPRPYERDV